MRFLNVKMALLFFSLFSWDASTCEAFQDENPIPFQLNLADSLKFSEPNMALRIVEEIKKRQDFKGPQNNIRADFILAQVYTALGRYDSSSIVLNDIKSLKNFEFDSILKAKVYNQLGINETKKGEYALAVEHLNETLKIYDAFNDNENKSIVLKDIGNVYFYSGQIETARLFYEKALIFGKNVNNEILTANIYNNLGRIYIELNDLETALNYLNLSYEIKSKYNNILGMANTNMNIGLINQLQNQPESAENYFKKALLQMQEISNHEGEAKLYHYLGVLYAEENRYAEAKEYLELGLLYSKEIQGMKLCMEIYENLSNVYSNTGNFEEALSYFKTYIALKDSMFIVQKKVEESDLKSKIEYDDFTSRVNDLKTKNEDLLRKERNMLLLVVLLGLFSVILTLIYFKKRRTN